MTNDEIRLQFEELKRWKAEAQAVEAEWNPQDLAKMLGATLGQSCRQVIQRRVPEILAENANLRAAADGLAEALEKVTNLDTTIFWSGTDAPPSKKEGDCAAVARAALAAYQATKL